MLKNLPLVASLLIALLIGGHVYNHYFYKGGRRRKAGGHRVNSDSVIMMYAEVRPNLMDRSTWYQVPINKNLPALEVA